MKPKLHWLLNALLAAALIGGIYLTSQIVSPAVREPLRRAEEAGQAGNYEAMAAQLRRVLAVQVAPSVLHNLGNAEFQQGRSGAAILAWERAHALDPQLRQSTSNLRYARGKLGIDLPELSWPERYSSFLAPDVWIWTATLSIWLAIVLLAAPYLFAKPRTSWLQGSAVVAIGLFLLTLPALAGIASRARLGVILTPDTLLRLTPTAEGEVVGHLAEGEMARLEMSRGPYVYIRAGGDRAGWVGLKEFAKLWP